MESAKRRGLVRVKEESDDYRNRVWEAM
jgi:hypothetical protein